MNTSLCRELVIFYESVMSASGIGFTGNYSGSDCWLFGTRSKLRSKKLSSLLGCRNSSKSYSYYLALQLLHHLPPAPNKHPTYRYLH